MSAPTTTAATVVRTSRLSAHLVTVTLRAESFTTTGVPDEYVRLLIPPAGAALALPTIDESWNVVYPEGAAELASRVYTISDHRVVDGVPEVDVDIALHDHGVGSDWVRRCGPGDQVGMIEPHGLYAATDDVAWQLLVCDITGVPALARILRGLRAGQRVEAVVVLTDAADELPLPSPADVTVRWVVVEDERGISEALSSEVLGRDLPEADVEGGRYVWFAGEAKASRAVRRRLRRELGWPQSDFYTCGYWQFDQEAWDARYAQVAAEVDAQSREAYATLAETDQGAYLDAIDDIYEKAGL